MASSKYSTIFAGLSGLGFLLLWGAMVPNGSLEALFESVDSGVLPNGRAIQKTYTGVWAVDYLLVVLVVFFDGLNNFVDVAPYLMLLEIVGTLFVINMMVLVESRRGEKRSALRSSTLWQYLWNCGGVAVFFPIYASQYIKRGVGNDVPLPSADAQALPLSAFWSIVMALPLMIPAFIPDVPPFLIQRGVVAFFFAFPTLSGLQRVVRSVISVTGIQGSKSPVKRTYVIIGLVSSMVHVGIALYATLMPDLELSLSRVYVPNYNAIQRGQPNIMTEAALFFIQNDYVIINVVVLLLSLHVFSLEPSSASKRTSGSLLALVSLMAVFGAGAGLAYVLYAKEDRQYASSKNLGKNPKAKVHRY